MFVYYESMVGELLRPGDERDVKAAQFEIEKEDVFHVKNLYEWMHDWLEDHSWEDPDSDDDKFEHYYYEKRLQGGTREHRAWWRLQKFPIENNYFRYVMLINWRNLVASKTEVVQEGQKVSTWRGDLTLQIEAWLQLDYKNMWKDHWFLKHFDNWYRNRLWKQQKEKWKRELWREAYFFSGWIKQFLDMKVPFEKPENFHPKGGTGPNPTPEE